MTEHFIKGKRYLLPSRLTPFQQEMYVHLVNWKWEHITRDSGYVGETEYDTVLPDSVADKLPLLYPIITDAFKKHLEKYGATKHKFGIRVHKYFNHMASSQAANANLFLPILTNPKASDVLKKLKPDLKSIASSELDNGYRIEFWDEPSGDSSTWDKHPGNLRDKNSRAGTDSDIAIAYYNQADELCLWLVEHKLTEKEFTTCGGYDACRKEKAREAKGITTSGKRRGHHCDKRFEDYLNKPQLCYYHDVCQYEYWNITKRNSDFFANTANYAECPFQGGMNQLWRNQLLAMSIEQNERQPFNRVYFSVVRHPGNESLCPTLVAYKNLLVDDPTDPKFSEFTSADVIAAASELDDAEMNKWVKWYKELYDV